MQVVPRPAPAIRSNAVAPAKAGVHVSPMKPILLPCLLLGAALDAQAPAQDPDIFLARLTRQGGTLTVSEVRNVTRRAGYDNQPSFAPDGRSVFYTSTREDRQADIYRYDIARDASTRVTVTAPESEYSAAVIPGTNDLAVIRVERDSTQRLWRVPLGDAGKAGAMGRVVLERVKPAGYFAFADAQTLALFVLGRPNSLQLANASTGRADTIVVNVGRSLHRIPGRQAISYVSKMYDENWWLMSLDLATRHFLPVALMPKGVEDYAWLPDGRIVAGQGSKLLVCNPATDAQWVELVDLERAGIGGITRLAVSPAGDRIAIVAVPR